MFEINGSAINASAINGNETAAVSFSATASGSLWKAEQSVYSIASGSLWKAEQIVGRQASGSLWKAEQTVIVYARASGSLWKVEQSVVSIASGSLWKAEQTVRDTISLSNVTRFGWDLILYVGGVEIPSNQIHGDLDVVRNENSAALLNVTLINRAGIQDFNLWHGKTITLDIEQASGITRIYTGVVDIPDIDLVNKSITLRCTNRRNEQINEQLASELPFIGHWSDAIFGTPDDVAGELTQRLLTTTKTVDFDAYGNYTIANYLPKATADFVLGDADIYRREPSLQVASRGRLINRVNVEFEYRYTRLRHRERSFTLYGATFCDVINTPGLQYLSVAGIESNLEGFGWPLKPNSKSFTYLPLAGWKNCGYGPFIWSPYVQTATTSTVKDEDGNVISDANGNALTEVTNRTITDYTKAFATEVNWVAAKRFAQDIAEKINIQVNAPQSINQYGVIEQYQRNGYSFDYNASDFEREEYYQAPTGFISTDGDYYLDKTGTAAHYQKALITSIAMADTTIHRSHRDNHITFETPPWPEIDLRHTVQITAGVIQGKGKVSEITHRFNIKDRFASTVVKLSFSQARGTQAAGSVAIPILNAPLIGGFDTGTLKMYTYLGGELGGVDFGQTTEKVEGMITPAIDDESRNRQEYETSYTYNTQIQNDDLVVEF